MLRLLPLLAALVTLPPLASAAGSPPTLEPGVLTVGLHPSSPRFQSSTLSAGRVLAPRGFEVDLARSLAARLGVSTSFRYVARRAAFLAPGDKPWDIGLDQLTEAEVARARLPLVPYLDVSQAVLLRRRLAQPVRTKTDLRFLRLCAASGSAGAKQLSSLHSIEPPAFASSESALTNMLLAKRCDAAIGDAPALAAERTLAPGLFGPLAGALADTPDRYVLVLPAGSPLAPDVRRALRSLAARGTIAQLERKWFGLDLARLPLLKPKPGRIRVTLIGDSVSAALNYESTARTILARGLDFRFEAQACRRLAARSCGSPPQPTALEQIARDGEALGQIVIMDIGYNDSASSYGAELDQAMRSMLARGVRHVIWVTLRERYSDYHSINEVIRRAAARWPEIQVADWNAFSRGKPWFASDGIHLNAAGALGIAQLLRPLLAPLASQ